MIGSSNKGYLHTTLTVGPHEMDSMLKRKRPAYEDDSDEEIASYGRQILPVANLPSNFDGEPEDGMQYLFTVRYVWDLGIVHGFTDWI